MKRWILCMTLVAMTPAMALARAHCYCKAQSLGTTIKDFGAIGSYGTQVGHDADCRALCDGAANGYMNATNRAAACAASGGNAIVAVYAVGTRSYQSGDNFTCAIGGVSAARGSIQVFPLGHARQLKLNDRAINPTGIHASVTLPASDKFANFEFIDDLPSHLQAWSYTARLYRDGALVQEFSERTRAGLLQHVTVKFSGQPASAAHGHRWKIEYHNSGPGADNGSYDFRIP